MAPNTIPYEFLTEDASVANVAIRFNYTPSEVWKATQEAYPKFKDKESSSVQPGDIIAIPVRDKDPDDAYDWLPRCPVENPKMSLTDLCKRELATAPSLAAPLLWDPVKIWFNIRNIKFRARHIKKGERGPDSARFDAADPEDLVQLPYKKISVPTIPVAPTTPEITNSWSKPNVVTIKVVGWYEELKEHVNSIATEIEAWSLYNDMRQRAREECSSDCSLLNALSGDLHVLQEFNIACKQYSPKDIAEAKLKAPSEEQAESIDHVAGALAEAAACAGQYMLLNPAKYLCKNDESGLTDAKVKPQEHTLLQLVTNEMAHKNALQLMKSPDGELIGCLRDSYLEAIQILANSSYAADAEKLLGQAMNYVPTLDGPPATPPPDTLSALTVISAFPSSVISSANRGFRSAISILYAMRQFPKVLGDEASATKLAESMRARLEKNVCGLFFNDTFDGKEVTAEMKAKADEVIKKLSSGKVEEFNALEKEAKGTPATIGACWKASMVYSLLGWVQLYGAVAGGAEDKTVGEMFVRAAGLAQQASTTVVSTAETIMGIAKTLNPKGKVALALGEALGGDVACGAGIFAAVLALGLGIKAIVDDIGDGEQPPDYKKLIIDGVGTVGAALSLAGWLCTIPGLQVAGAIVTGLAAGVGAVIITLEKLRKGSERVFSARFAQFRSSEHVKAIAGDVDEFGKALDAVEAAVKKASFFHVPTLYSESEMKKLGFVDEEVKLTAGEGSWA